MLEHSKAALVIAVSALETRTRVSDREGVFRESEVISRPPPPLPRPGSVSASAGLAVIANVNKDLATVFVFECTFEYLNGFAVLDSSQTCELASVMETNQAALALFKYFKKIGLGDHS